MGRKKEEGWVKLGKGRVWLYKVEMDGEKGWNVLEFQRLF